jgi:hypothetical protein
MVMAIARDSSMGGRSSKKTTKVVVKQDMIDFIKNQGMAAALKRAGSISAKGGKGEAEFLEGVRRMYGASRLEAATKAASASKTKKTTAYGKNNMPAYRPATGPAKGTGMPGKGPTARMTEAAAKKKSGTTDPFARAVFGAGRALGRTLSVEPRVTAAQAKKNLEAKKRAAANKNK